MTSHNAPGSGTLGPSGRFGKLRGDLTGEVDTVDRAIYDAIASTPTPLLDKVMTWSSNAATNSKLWLAVAVVLAATGRRGRSAQSAASSPLVPPPS